MNIKTLVLLCTLFACVFGACSKNDTEEKWAEEEAKLAEWIKTNKPDLPLINNGIYFESIGVEYPDNIQPQEPGHYVLVDYECRFLSDNVVEQVSYKDWKAYGALYPSTYREGGPELWAYEWWGSMGVGLMHENERANIYVPSRLLRLQDFKTRVYNIHLRKVINSDMKTYQEKLMGRYMKQYCDAVDTITITDKGEDYYVIYHVAKEGSGSAIGSTTVNTRTTEKYFMQDMEEPRICFSERAIRWNDNSGKFSSKFSKMFQTVNKGGKIIALMPYRMMYGVDPYKDGSQHVAPLFSVLIYEINIDN